MRANGKCSNCWDIFQHHFFLFSFGNNIRMSNSLVSDQVWCSLGPDLCKNYLQRSPARQQTTKLPISRKRVNLFNNSLPTGNLACFCRLLIFFSKSAFLNNSFRNTTSVKQLGSSSGPTFYQPRSESKLLANVVSRLHFPFCRAWSMSKLFANVISRQHFVRPDLYPNFYQTWSADDSLLCLIWVQTVCKWNQQTAFCPAWSW